MCTPRSGDAAHIAENIAVLGSDPASGAGALVLDADDLAMLDALNEEYPYYWCPKPNDDTLG